MSGGVIGTDRGSFCFLSVPVSQNDCLMEVMLSVFRVRWASVIALSRPHVNNQFRTLLRDTKILTIFLLSDIEKFIDRCETKTTDVDPSIVGQPVRPLKNNCFKPCSLTTLITKTNFIRIQVKCYINIWWCIQVMHCPILLCYS